MNKLKMDVVESEIFKTTPELFVAWLKKELEYNQWGNDGKMDAVGKDEIYLSLFEIHPSMEANVFDVQVLAYAPGTTLYGKHPLLAGHDTGTEAQSRGVFDLGISLRFEALQLSTDRTRITAGCKDFPGLQDRLAGLWIGILRDFERAEEKRRPETGATLDEWLAWRDAESKAGRKITYKQLAQQSKYTEGSFKQAGRLWKKMQKNY